MGKGGRAGMRHLQTRLMAALAVGAAGILLVTACGVPKTPAGPAPGVAVQVTENLVGQPRPEVGCIEFDEAGELVGDGEASVAGGELGAALTEVFGQNQSKITGIAYCSRTGGLAVFVKQGETEAAAALANVAAAYPEVHFENHFVPRSYTELQDLIQAIPQTQWGTVGLVEAGPDIFAGGLDLAVDQTAGGSPEELVAKAAELVTSAVGPDVPLYWRLTGQPETLSLG